MRITKSKLLVVIKEETDSFLKEESFRRKLFPKLQLIRAYYYLIDKLEPETIGSESTLSSFEIMRNYLKADQILKYFVETLGINKKLIYDTFYPLYKPEELNKDNLTDLKAATYELLSLLEDFWEGEDKKKMKKDTEKKKAKYDTSAGTAMLQENAEVSEIMDQMANVIELIEYKKAQIIQSGPSENRQDVEKVIDSVVEDFSNFQAVVGAHLAAGKDELDESGLPNLFRDNEERKEKNMDKKKKKQMTLKEVFGFGKKKSSAEKALEQYKKFKKWSARAKEQGRIEDAELFKKQEMKWYRKWENLKDEEGSE
jgi:hypothetical protein